MASARVRQGCWARGARVRVGQGCWSPWPPRTADRAAGLVPRTRVEARLLGLVARASDGEGWPPLSASLGGPAGIRRAHHGRASMAGGTARGLDARAQMRTAPGSRRGAKVEAGLPPRAAPARRVRERAAKRRAERRADWTRGRKRGRLPGANAVPWSRRAYLPAWRSRGGGDRARGMARGMARELDARAQMRTAPGSQRGAMVKAGLPARVALARRG
jgi:hypothetical protein